MLDDEPEYLDWLEDYLLAKHNLKVDVALDVGSALEHFRAADYRIYLIDLNVPFGNWSPGGTKLNSIYHEYKGLNAIREIRTKFTSGARVVAYSAHENAELKSTLSERLFATYVLKGRAADIKSTISQVLRHDPKAP